VFNEGWEDGRTGGGLTQKKEADLGQSDRVLKGANKLWGSVTRNWPRMRSKREACIAYRKKSLPFCTVDEKDGKIKTKKWGP